MRDVTNRLRTLRKLRKELDRLWIAGPFNQEAVGKVLTGLRENMIDQDQIEVLRRCHAAGLGLYETVRRTHMAQDTIKFFFGKFDREPALNITADFCGDPPAERSALTTFKPWEPVYEADPVFKEDGETQYRARPDPVVAPVSPPAEDINDKLKSEFDKIFGVTKPEPIAPPKPMAPKPYKRAWTWKKRCVARDALLSDKPTYQGKPCPKCGCTERRSDYHTCTHCYGYPGGRRAKEGPTPQQVADALELISQGYGHSIAELVANPTTNRGRLCVAIALLTVYPMLRHKELIPLLKIQNIHAFKVTMSLARNGKLKWFDPAKVQAVVAKVREHLTATTTS